MSFSGSPREVAAELRRRQERVRRAVVDTSEAFGLRLQGQVRANMSGRPGPRAQTGDLRRSVHVSTWVDEGGGVVRTRVQSNEPQVWRLELGFVGTDSLGRHVEAPPYPAWRPAMLTVGPEYERAVRAAVVAALREDG